MRVSPRFAPSVIAISAAILLLAGCSSAGTAARSASPKSSSSASASASASAGASGGGSQSVVEGCTLLANSLKSSTESLKASFTAIATDPSKAIAGLNDFASAFDVGLKKVTNQEVKVAADKADASLKAMNGIVTEDIKTPTTDTTKLQVAVTAFQTDFAAIGTVCK